MCNCQRLMGALVTVAALLCTSPALAVLNVNYLPDAGATMTVQNIDPIRTGCDMAGATVTVHYVPGLEDGAPNPETVNLTCPSPPIGRAIGVHWMLELPGDSDVSDWMLFGNASGSFCIDFIEIDLFPGNAVWDKCDAGAATNTPNSGPGITFNNGPCVGGSGTTVVTGGGNWDVDVQYWNPVALSGAPMPLGDVHQIVRIDFVNGCFDVNDQMTWRDDTDETLFTTGVERSPWSTIKSLYR